MATQMTIDRIGTCWMMGLTPSYTRAMGGFDIPGGHSRRYATGYQGEQFTVEGAINSNTEGSVTAAKNKFLQLAELVSNPNYPFIYMQFAANENTLDGWYQVESLSAPRNRENFVHYPFQMTVWRIGCQADYRLAQWWDSAAETYTGANWTGALTARRLVSLPYNVTSVDNTVTETRATIDGSNQVLLNPTYQTITFKSSATIAHWFIAECKVYDSVTAGDTTEANWVQVYSPSHIFGGDCIVQNGMLRYKIGASLCTFYALDTVANPDAWASIGNFLTALTGNHDAPLVQFNLESLSPDEITWQEIRNYAATPICLKFTLRRGAKHCKITLKTRSGVIDTATYVQLAGTNYYDQLFNASANGAAAGGNLATDADDNYHCAYCTTRNVVAGFALCDQPTFQPTDTGNNDAFAESNTWEASVERTFFVFGFSQDTSSFNLTTARATADAIAAQCLYAVKQEPALVTRGFLPTS